MNYFEEATLRLKQQLGVTQDKEVAELLGISSRAWAGRKKNGTFPKTELLALPARRPDLSLDLDYILGSQQKATLSPSGELAMQKLKANTQAFMRLSDELGYEPPMVWGALIAELMFSHGLTEAGAGRILETLKSERKTP
jgi:transcriptional regulator with XRE-family HTH domain